MQSLVDRSRGRSDRLKAKFTELENADAALGKQLENVRLELVRMVQASQAGLDEEIRTLKQVNQELAMRVAELEKPRGLRALWARLFGRRKSRAEKTLTSTPSWNSFRPAKSDARMSCLMRSPNNIVRPRKHAPGGAGRGSWGSSRGDYLFSAGFFPKEFRKC